MPSGVTFIREEDILEKQAEAEERMLREFREGKYTFDAPLVELDPYGVCPCAAVVLFRTAEETAVTVTVRGKEPSADISHTFPKAAEHILPVLGLYPGFENSVDIELYQGSRHTVKITTGPVTAKAAELISMETSAEYLQGDLIFVTPSSAMDRLSAFDLRGDLRWYSSIALAMAVKKLANGRLLVGGDRLFGYPYFASGMYEMDLVGKIYKEYLVPGGVHHDQFELPNGDLLAITNDLSRDTREDVCVLLDRESGEVKKTWDYTRDIQPGAGCSSLATEEDWFHNNSLWVDQKTNSLSLSGRHVDALVNLDYDSGAIRWILGDPEGWSEDKQRYFFKPERQESFGWQYAQHAVSVLPCGDILCFDNGTIRSKNKEQTEKLEDKYSRGVRYRIDTDKMSIEQVWEFGKELGTEFFSRYICNVDYLGDEHYLVHSGGIQIRDGLPVEMMVFDLRADPSVRCESATICLVHDKKVLEMHVRGNFYRGHKLPLYHDNGSNLCLGRGRRVGSLSATKRAELPAAASTGTALPAACMAHLIDHGQFIDLKARFEPEQQVYVVLEQAGAAYGYRVKMGERFARAAGLPYLQLDDKNTSTLISKSGLSGQYDLKVMIDGALYETGSKIVC